MWIIERSTDLENELISCYGEGWAERVVMNFGVETYTPLYLKWVTNKDLLYSTWNSAQCYVADWMRGEFAGQWTCVHVWLSPFAIHLKL